MVSSRSIRRPCGTHLFRLARPVVLLLALMLVGRASFAYEQSTTSSGSPLSWSSSCVYWSMAEQSLDNSGFDDPAQEHVSFDDLYGAVAASFDAWDDVDCSYLYFVETAPMHCLDVGYHHGSGNANRIFFRDHRWIDADAPWREEGQIALTSVFYDTDTGQIYDVDIEFNAEYFELTTTEDDSRTDIQNALTHELGHLVGLGHSDVRESTMYLNADDGELHKRDLENDDIEGLCSIYPLTQDPASCNEPPGGLDLECGAAVWCEEPNDGITSECTFDELVCCCDQAGGLGSCSWEDATQCRTASRHAVLQLDQTSACPDEQPSPMHTCCCTLGDDGAICAWRRFNDCQESSGLPLQSITSTHLCGQMPNEDGCGCAVAGRQSAFGYVDLITRLIPR